MRRDRVPNTCRIVKMTRAHLTLLPSSPSSKKDNVDFQREIEALLHIREHGG